MSSSFAQQFKRGGPAVLSDSDRKQASILIVEPEASIRNSLRQMLVRLGIGVVSDAADHLQALKKFEERTFTHVIFEAKKTTMPSSDFISKVFELDESVVAIPTSWEPNVDDVFGLLMIGARGYLVKPFTEGSVDEAVTMATKGEPMADAILYAKDRNEALAALILTQVDKLAVTLRQSQQFETAKRDLPRRVMGLKRSVDIGKIFARGGPDRLLDAMIEFCLERSNGPATRLGRLRKRLISRKSGAAADSSASPSVSDKAPSPGIPDVPASEAITSNSEEVGNLETLLSASAEKGETHDLET